MNIVVSYSIPEIGIHLLKKEHDVYVHTDETPLTKQELITLLQEKKADALLAILTDTIDEDVLSVPSLKVVSNYAVGYNNIDLDAAQKNGVVITNTPGVLTDAVAEHAVALILASMRRIVESDTFTRSGMFKGWKPLLLLGSAIKGRTLCIVGGGRIGTRVAEIMKKGFDMDVVYYDIQENKHLSSLGARFVSLDEGVAMADVVSIHLPLLDSTHRLFDEAMLRKMKKGSYLINTARGPIVEEQALIRVLADDHFSGVALDVFENEPAIAKELIDNPRVILTPHSASANRETRDAMSTLAAENILAVLGGEEPPHRVV